MKKLLLILCTTASLAALEQLGSWPLVSLREKNIQADTAFLTWRINAPESTISSELKNALTNEGRAFLVEQSQLPFSLYKDQKKLKAHVTQVVDAFLTRCKEENKALPNRRELEELVRELIIPEYDLYYDPGASEQVDKTYNALLETLALYKTPAGTYLDEWALRYLTSESQLVALELLEKETKKGSRFNLLSDHNKVKLLDKVSQVVVRQFMQNLQPVHRKFHFTLPPYSEVAVKNRVDIFLQEKFGL